MSRNSTLRVLLTGAVMVLALFAPAFRAQDSTRKIEITAKRFSFEPAEITLKKGEPVTLEVKSLDTSHGLRLRELGVDMTIRAGGTAEAQFTPDKTGDFVAHCSVFCGSGHGSMMLTVHVTE